MKQFFRFMAAALLLCGAWSCEYDDEDLWNKVDDLEQQINENKETIASLQALMEALNQGKVIVNVEQTDNGYMLTFSDGSTVELKNGEKGEKGDKGDTGDKGDKGDKGDTGEAGSTGDAFFQSVVPDYENGVVIITLADGTVITVPLAPEESPASETRVLTFEDVDAKFTAYTIGSATITKWSELIDNPQYGGALIYGDYSYTGYYWYDEGNTGLYSEINDMGAYWGGGHAISNYYMADYSTADYTTQLAISCGAEGAAGHNGSANFCVHNGYVDEYSWKPTLASFYFKDGSEHVVDHLYITNTSYLLHSVELGDSFNTPATDTTWVKVTAYGYDAAGNEVGSSEFYLVAEGRQFVKEWTKWDLSGLGKVNKVAFNISASADQSGSYGMNCPAYFAYDDVAVVF